MLQRGQNVPARGLSRTRLFTESVRRPGTVRDTRRLSAAAGNMCLKARQVLQNEQAQAHRGSPTCTAPAAQTRLDTCKTWKTHRNRTEVKVTKRRTPVKMLELSLGCSLYSPFKLYIHIHESCIYRPSLNNNNKYIHKP